MGWKASSDLAASLCEVDANGLAKVDMVTGKTTRPVTTASQTKLAGALRKGCPALGLVNARLPAGVQSF